MHPQLPGTAESHRFGNPRALPLYPIASTFSSVWSVTTVPTWRRAQVERLASSSAIRMYTSYKGIRSTGGGVAPSARTFRKCVLAGTPSLARLMDLQRSEERRVGKECRSRWGTGHEKKKTRCG